MAVFFVTQYNSSLSTFVLNFRILTQAVAEKSLTEKKVYRQTDKPTNIITEKAKTIYPLYTSYRGYKYSPTFHWGDIKMTPKSSFFLSMKSDQSFYFVLSVVLTKNILHHSLSAANKSTFTLYRSQVNTMEVFNENFH